MVFWSVLDQLPKLDVGVERQRLQPLAFTGRAHLTKRNWTADSGAIGFDRHAVPTPSAP